MPPETLPTIDPEQTIPQRFARVVAAFPDRLAVQTDAHAVTYRALDAWSDRFAAAIGPADAQAPVAVALAHEAPLAAALLGVLKAGHPYVCFDPRLPVARLHDLLDDADVGLVVTDAHGPGLDRTRFAGRLIDADALPEPQPVRWETDPGDAAALFYTSGSTGTPKAVVRSHRAMLHNALTYADTLGLTPDDRLTLLASARFAASASPLFGALLHGACVLPFDVRRDGIQAMIRWMEAERITVYHSVPSLFRLFAESLPEGANCPALRVVRLGGEAVHPADVALFKSRFAPPCLLVNGFSITEAGGNICAFVVDHACQIEGHHVPIGVAVEGRTVALVDADGAPVPDGAPGEMIVESRFLATGYWRDAARTATHFEFAPGGVSRFRTGERARRRPDGNLEHLGRKDRQVKIRGFRIEPGEVEAALCLHPSVREAAVVAYEHAPGDPHLAAYLTPTGPRPSDHDLRAFAQERLPDYMIPTVFGWLDDLPRTPGGKISYPDLPAPTASEPHGAYEEPQTALEHQLAVLWAELLGIEKVGRHDDFFERGGHSLHAARLVLRIERDLNKRCTLGTLLEAPTPAALAEALSRPDRPWSPLVTLQAGGDRTPWFCVHGRGGHAEVIRPLAQHLRPDQPVYGFEAPGLDGKSAPHQSVEALAACYLQALSAVQSEGPYFLGGYSFGGLVAYEMAQQLHARGETVGLVAMIDTSVPLQLALQNHPVAYRWKTVWRAGRKIVSMPARLARNVFRSNGKPLPSQSPSEEALHRYVKVRRACMMASRHYLPLSYAGPVVLIQSSQRRDSTGARESVAGWNEVAADLRSIVVEGTHHDLVAEPTVRTVARMLEEQLQNARERAG